MPFATEQERFWAGEFGQDYIERNRGSSLVASNLSLFARALHATDKVSSVLELGANIGLNLAALAQLLPHARLTAVEINSSAAAELRRQERVEVHNGSLLEFASPLQWDLVFTKGVLIHINPDALPAAYDVMYRASRRYLMVCEYYNPTPTSVPYRGHAERLFKRDFAGELLDRFGDLRLVDYGFVYHRDPEFALDDSTWFMLEKRAY
ncbi:MAG: pseudaminic acid biosynthesis-associated methylase [Pseudomonadota bacterium]